MAGHPLRPATRRRLGRPLPHQQADRPRAHPTPQKLSTTPHKSMVLSGIRPSFPGLSRSAGQITHVLLTRSPLIHPKASSFDLHVLSTPPAFVLSQNQTLQTKTPRQNEKEFNIQKNLIKQKTPTNWHQKNNTTPQQTGKQRDAAKNNKQKPPNTLLSSQTTRRFKATPPAYYLLVRLSSSCSGLFRPARS